MRAGTHGGHANKFVGVFGVPEHQLAQTGHGPAFSSGMKTALIGSFLLPSQSIRHQARGATPAGCHHVDRKSRTSVTAGHVESGASERLLCRRLAIAAGPELKSRADWIFPPRDEIHPPSPRSSKAQTQS